MEISQFESHSFPYSSIALDLVEFAHLERIKIKNNQHVPEKGGGIFSIQTKNLIIQNSEFFNLSAVRGGAIFEKQTLENISCKVFSSLNILRLLGPPLKTVLLLKEGQYILKM